MRTNCEINFLNEKQNFRTYWDIYECTKIKHISNQNLGKSILIKLKDCLKNLFVSKWLLIVPVGAFYLKRNSFPRHILQKNRDLPSIPTQLGMKMRTR